MGKHVLTLALGAVKHATGGKPPEDSATGEQDTDLQKAGVLDRIRRASRSLAKTRRDQSANTSGAVERRCGRLQPGRSAMVKVEPEVDG
jgi:hypothetical protein